MVLQIWEVPHFNIVNFAKILILLGKAKFLCQKPLVFQHQMQISLSNKLDSTVRHSPEINRPVSGFHPVVHCVANGVDYIFPRTTRKARNFVFFVYFFVCVNLGNFNASQMGKEVGNRPPGDCIGVADRSRQVTRRVSAAM